MTDKDWRPEPWQKDIEGVACEFSCFWQCGSKIVFGIILFARHHTFRSWLLIDSRTPFESCWVWYMFFLFFVYIYLLYQNILLFNLLFFERVLSFIQKNPFFTDTSSKANNNGAAIARFWAKKLLLNPVPLVVRTSLFFSRCYQCPSIVSGQLRDTFGILLPQMSLCHHPSAIPYQEQFAAISLFPQIKDVCSLNTSVLH